MRGTSRSAEHVALFRALESARRRDRIVDDPFARRFLPARYRLVARLATAPRIGRRIERYVDARWPAGPRASAVVRTRLIDDLLAAALNGASGTGGAGQVLVLGAGYDSRAYRLRELATVHVFEVDHPATQATKRRRLDIEPGHVTFVPVDLIHDDLGAALSRHGFASGVRTAVIWEGVTNYLTAEAVDTTMRQLARMTGTGSRIIFTYIDRAVLDGALLDGNAASVEAWHAALRRQGEPWTFGFDPAELPRYLAERGLTLVEDLSTRDAAERYLAPLRRHEPTATWYRIALAERP